MISVIINVKNGEKHLEKCLNALYQFEDIVLLDNYSTDQTCNIAANYSNVRIFKSPSLGMGKVRNLAATYTKYDWVFFVDCDEVVNQDLANEILKLSLKDNTVYKMYRCNYYHGFHLDSSAWEKDWIVRLYNRNTTKYSETEVHESVITNNLQVDKISSGFIYHFPYDEALQLVDKMRRYSDAYAKDKVKSKKVLLPLVPLRMFFMFIKCYILKLGFLDGYEGFLISSYNAIGVFTKYIKLYELRRNKKINLLLKIDRLNDVDAIISDLNNQTQLLNQVNFAINGVFDEPSLHEMSLKFKHQLYMNFAMISPVESVKHKVDELFRSDINLDGVLYLSDNNVLKDLSFIRNSYLKIIENKPVTVGEVYYKIV